MEAPATICTCSHCREAGEIVAGKVFELLGLFIILTAYVLLEN